MKVVIIIFVLDILTVLYLERNEKPLLATHGTLAG